LDARCRDFERRKSPRAIARQSLGGSGVPIGEYARGSDVAAVVDYHDLKPSPISPAARWIRDTIQARAIVIAATTMLNSSSDSSRRRSLQLAFQIECRMTHEFRNRYSITVTLVRLVQGVPPGRARFTMSQSQPQDPTPKDHDHGSDSYVGPNGMSKPADHAANRSKATPHRGRKPRPRHRSPLPALTSGR